VNVVAGVRTVTNKRLNASANLERPVLNRPFGFLQHKKAQENPKGAKKRTPEMISVAEAIQIVKQQTRPLATERVKLEHALNRVLAEDIVADSDLPPFDRAQMDGYAVRAEDTAGESPGSLPREEAGITS
jgi:hypothetical protein